MVTVLPNGLLLMGLDPAWSVFAKGILFLLVVATTYEKTKGKLVL
jgi:ribose/xylose/arabinose/galactoside ABC-type transport system permease subunit